MPRISLVGDGHGGLEDYATIPLWFAAESGVDYGSQIEAACLGNCGSGYTLTGSSIYGAKVYTQGVIYDGANELLLAKTDTAVIEITNAIDISDIVVTTTNQYVSAFGVGTDYLTSNRCIFDNQTAGLNAIQINGAYTNTNINNFVARGGLDTINSGYLNGTNLTNGIVHGGADKGVEASGGVGVLIVTDVFSFNNTGSDYDEGQLTLNTCASEDLTGSITGYTSAELVDFANKDYRTKSTSFLATAGTGGSFIGAFLESSASVASDLTTTITDEASIVAGGSTITLTLTGDTFVATGATFDAERQGLIDNLVSAQSEANGWNAEKVNLPVTDVVRTSDTVVTITLSALANYDISSDEEITSTIQASALVTSASDVVSTPTFTISAITNTISASITEINPAFSEVINSTVTGNVSISITEVCPAFSESLTVDITGLNQTSITEINPVFSESISTSVTRDAITVDITEIQPAFSEALTSQIQKNISSLITEISPSFTESVSISLLKSIDVTITETSAPFSENLSVSIPTKAVVNFKNILYVKKNTNSVKISKRTNKITLSKKTNIIRIE